MRSLATKHLNTRTHITIVRCMCACVCVQGKNIPWHNEFLCKLLPNFYGHFPALFAMCSSSSLLAFSSHFYTFASYRLRKYAFYFTLFTVFLFFLYIFLKFFFKRSRYDLSFAFIFAPKTSSIAINLS